MLNITGGGEERMKKGKTLHYLTPSEVFDINPAFENVQAALRKLFN